MKKNIETVQGADVYPAAQQMLIHQGKVLKDTTTLEENKVAESSFIVIMLSKVKFTAWTSPTTVFNHNLIVSDLAVLLVWGRKLTKALHLG